MVIAVLRVLYKSNFRRWYGNLVEKSSFSVYGVSITRTLQTETIQYGKKQKNTRVNGGHRGKI